MPSQRRQWLQETLTADDAFATTLLVLAVDAYGTELAEWDPQTLRMELEDDFDIKLPPANFDRLMTAVAILTGDDFYKSAPDFIAFCNVLSGDLYDPRTWAPADAGEISWGITEAMIIEPPDEDDEEPFSPEILGYIGHVLDMEGIIQPPDILRLAVRNVADVMSGVQAGFSDDPEMFEAILGFEHDKVEDIDTYVRGRLQLLIQQLEGLPLSSGDAKGAVRALLSGLHTGTKQ